MLNDVKTIGELVRTLESDFGHGRPVRVTWLSYEKPLLTVDIAIPDIGFTFRQDPDDPIAEKVERVGK